MPLARAVMAETSRTFELRGRTARASYLWFLASAIVLYASSITLCIIALPPARVSVAIYIVTAIFYLPVTAAGVRRLHDVGESAALMLDPLKPVAGFVILLSLLWLFASNADAGIFVLIMSTFFYGKTVMAIYLVAVLFVAVATLLYFSNTMGLLLLPSQPGTKKFGPNPHEAKQ